MAQNELHQIGVAEADRHRVEAICAAAGADAILHALERAQKKSWEVLRILHSQLVEGMTEAEARPWALEILKQHGVTKNWHRPNLRFGPGSRLSFNDPLSTDYRLKPGDSVMIDLGPVWKDEELGLEMEGDVGETIVWKPVGAIPSEQQHCIDVSRELFEWGRQQVAQKTGAAHSGRGLYEQLAERAQSRGLVLLQGVEGHRLSDFPHHQYSKHRISQLDFVPTPGRWVLEVQVLHPTLPYGAFYEDLV
jgi:hypothetical protein